MDRRSLDVGRAAGRMGRMGTARQHSILVDAEAAGVWGDLLRYQNDSIQGKIMWCYSALFQLVWHRTHIHEIAGFQVVVVDMKLFIVGEAMR